MQGIGFKNFRSLRDTGIIGIKPVTLLLGRNGSGKSTFLRALPLLRQSTETQTEGPLLLFGTYVDFGGYSDLITRGARTDRLSIGFRFRLTPDRSRGRLRTVVARSIPTTVWLDIKGEPRDESGNRLTNVLLKLAGHRIRVSFDQRGRLTDVSINGRKFDSRGLQRRLIPEYRLIPSIWPDRHESDYAWEAHVASGRAVPFASELTRASDPFFHGRTRSEQKWGVLDSIPIDTNAKMLGAIKGIDWPNTWADRTRDLVESSPHFKELRDCLIAYLLPRLLRQCDFNVSGFCAGVRYAGPVRASAQRYYRPQSLTVEEVDSEGSNVSVLLRRLSDRERQDFRSWTEEHFGIQIVQRTVGGHLTLKLVESGEKGEFNLADTGFGYSQALPLLLQLWSFFGRRSRFRLGFRDAPITYAIEQPELHLHPALQARFADMLMSTSLRAEESPLDLRLVVETHSEHIVNRIGERIHRGEISRDMINVVLFDRQPGEGTHLRSVEFDDEGVLEEWPYGFFDPDPISTGLVIDAH